MMVHFVGQVCICVLYITKRKNIYKTIARMPSENSNGTQ